MAAVAEVVAQQLLLVALQQTAEEQAVGHRVTVFLQRLIVVEVVVVITLVLRLRVARQGLW
jgi:hypothetical protein